MSGTVPLVDLAIGAAMDGQRGAFIGGGIGGAVGLLTGIVALTRGSDCSLAPGFPPRVPIARADGARLEARRGRGEGGVAGLLVPLPVKRALRFR
ncbi:MAG TPA: hypothetical protein VJO52_12085 [Gemmatimonadaceae bacterium]|nr:hypothetical protein [Gemmatimonadaceae bacterium]